jgi:2-C-methyl-D-erythritol 4-phosphate cytidylyltransferase
MRADRPKQYLTLGARTVIEHTLDALYACERIAAVVVAHNNDDVYWPTIDFDTPRPLLEAEGGQERADSVYNGLRALSGQAGDDDWVLVHDAARPCLRLADINHLIDSLVTDPVGGILAIPTRDTMKTGDNDQRISATLDRSRMWNALTPQMFRLGVLRKALEQARADGFAVTDEASAVEHIGLRPRLIEGHADNIKITRPEDLALAGFFLQQQERL